ncbi:P-loop NTPase fold protein [Tumidithrix elongata RA019]|uniref:P-loop NTPase fold protein n=1 Tax=Tumidithrix elongata BACA0141 TaxID=2716417 RepID=A0AAW9Q2K1_9CYAN|nr:P-loop NTPase fold protein [Tumidithrix elongata RA019]
MSQDKKSINSHIEEYLDYYCSTELPRSAVLLKGEWGSGKTWFIKQYYKKNNPREIDIWKDPVDLLLLWELWHKVNFVGKAWRYFFRKEQISSKKFLYVSLYGLDTLSAIDEAIFQELHPLWGSEQVKIAGNIIKSLLKGSLKIDLDGSGKNIASWNIKIPDLPRKPKDSNKRETNKRVLIFDDLERCSIEISNLLGYINQFVEHQNLKIIILADENRISKNANYLDFKEKLVSKTFNILPDFENVLKSFASEVREPIIEKFLCDHIDFIKDLYVTKANRENLRTLRNIILDLKRIFVCSPLKTKENPDILKDILKFLILFSIEISSAKIKSSDIGKLVREYKSLCARLSLKATLGNSLNSDKDKSDETDKDINIKDIAKENYDLYSRFDLDKVFPSEGWWENFFDKGLINAEELATKILSKYFPDDRDTPNWQKLYYWRKLSDEKFENLLREVETEYKDKKYNDIGEVKHVFGIFLDLSDKGIINQSKEDLLHSAKDYIDYLNGINKVSPSQSSLLYNKFHDNYNDTVFSSLNLPEFKQLSSYISSIQESVRIKSLPNDAKKLLDIMASNQLKFYQMVCRDNAVDSDYYTVPIFKEIDIHSFTSKLFSMVPDDQSFVFLTLKNRYQTIDDKNKELLSEIEWLKQLQECIVKEAEAKKGKPSGYHLKQLNEDYLNAIITNLESEEAKYAKSP